MRFPYAKISQRVFEKSAGENYGIYVASYGDEGVCKIGVTSTPRERLAGLQGATWVPITVTSFFFPYKPANTFDGLPDNYNILRLSAFALEAMCHEKLKELGLHLRGEFFEIFPDDADKVIRKVAQIGGFKLLTPDDLLGADVDIDGNADERLAFFQMANAAGLAKEVMLGGFGGGVANDNTTG